MKNSSCSELPREISHWNLLILFQAFLKVRVGGKGAFITERIELGLQRKNIYKVLIEDKTRCRTFLLHEMFVPAQHPARRIS